MNAIEVDGIGKRYRLNESRLSTVFSQRGCDKDDFWALRDITFSVRKGEALGIVGANGAGKSTLLKVLSRVTAPTIGRARVRGRLGTILEVGTGFHPELSGRENIYLSGAILGLRRPEIDARFDSIVDFAALDAFVDTPVKRYSSGMYVRLAFAVAAHLDPDILIVDEVLAVGDAGFQKKCLARMDEGMRQEGRTILFVSHNMQAIRHLCTRAVLLENGSLVADGAVNSVLTKYASGQRTAFDLSEKAIKNRKNRAVGRVLVVAFELHKPRAQNPWTFKTDESIRIRVNFKTEKKIDSLSCSLALTDISTGVLVTNLRAQVIESPIEAGITGSFCFEVKRLTLRPGDFAISFALGNADFSIIDDLLDSNVGLPILTMESDEQDMYSRMGIFDLDTVVSDLCLSSTGPR
jgi:lipopolysaccharide transport system ATP-binding protein